MRFSFYLPKQKTDRTFLEKEHKFKIPLKLMAIPFNIESESFNPTKITLSYSKDDLDIESTSFFYTSLKSLIIKNNEKTLAQRTFEKPNNLFHITETRKDKQIFFNGDSKDQVFELGAILEKDQIIFQSLKFFTVGKTIAFKIANSKKIPIFKDIKDISLGCKTYPIEKVENGKIMCPYITN